MELLMKVGLLVMVVPFLIVESNTNKQCDKKGFIFSLLNFKKCDVPFTQSLFDHPTSKKIRHEVLRTEFFRGIVDNNLAPEAYGGYMVQDAVFMYDVADLLAFAAMRLQRKRQYKFASFYRKSSESYNNYSRYFSENWRILPSFRSNVNMSVAASTYIHYETTLARWDPKRLAIGILACEMLWPWIAQQINATVPTTHVYRSWVDDNLSIGPSDTQVFIDKFFSQKDRRTCQHIFNEGMLNELNFFRSACRQSLVKLSSF